MMNYFIEFFRKLQPLIKIRLSAFIVIIMFINAVPGISQTKVSGIVTEEGTNLPLPGVNIIIEGTTTGVTTDMDGKYSIMTDASDASLVYSFMGYVTQTIAVNGQSEINIVLVADTKMIDEVVAIGYGTVRKKDLTGSVASVSGDKLKDIPISSAAELMTGKLAGVQVLTTEGSPDAEVKIRVRGGGSITQDNSPLYIVDGFPVESINDIAPSDIESIDVLKDASSTAIYGSRGANGVIIITTKSGKEGKVSVTYNGYYGFKRMAKYLDVLDPEDFVLWQYEAAVIRDNVTDQYENYFGLFSDYDLYKGLEGNDWQKQIFGNQGTSENHSFTINGGSEKTQFNFSYNKIEEKTIMLASNFKRNNLNFKLKVKPDKKFTLNFSARYSDTEIQGSGANEQDEKSSSDSRLKHVVIYTPIPLRDLTADSDDEESIGSLYPPSTSIYDNDRIKYRKKLDLSANATWKIIEGIKLSTEFGTQNRWYNENRFYGLSTYYVRDKANIKNQPVAIFSKDEEFTFRNANTITYEKKNIGTGHNYSILAGEETQVTQSVDFTSEVQGYPEFFDADMAFKLTTQGEDAYTIDQNYAADDKLLSFFGRAMYNYQGKYLFSATFRADGSSKFGKGNKWGYFPSAAVAWRISDESFMSNFEWLDNFKLRASFGSAGNNKIPSNLVLLTFSSQSTSYLNTSNSIWVPGLIEGNKILNNENLKWETTYTRNIGFDFGIIKNRINGSFEAYFNNTKDLLIRFPMGGPSGYDFQYRNLGETSNKGVELSINSVIINKKDFSLDFSFNIGINKNRIEDLGGLDNLTQSSGWASSEITEDYIVKVGGSVGEMYGYKTAGRYEADEFTWNGTEWVAKPGTVVYGEDIVGENWGPGALKLEDVDGNDTIDSRDQTVIGNANPKHTGGFSISAKYKGFDFAANFNWSYGNDIYNANKLEFTTTSKHKYRNMTTEMASGKRWTNIDAEGNRVTNPDELAALNANTTMWSPLTRKFVFHSWAVEDGSFLRLSSLTFGYTLPDMWMKKVFIKNLRIYTSAYNIFCLTNYTGYDPEVDTRRKTPLTPGVDFSAFPRSRSIVFGINLNF